MVAANSKAMGIKGKGMVTETETGMVMATATVGTGVMVKATEVREVVTARVRKRPAPRLLCAGAYCQVCAVFDTLCES